MLRVTPLGTLSLKKLELRRNKQKLGTDYFVTNLVSKHLHTL